LNAQRYRCGPQTTSFIPRGPEDSTVLPAYFFRDGALRYKYYLGKRNQRRLSLPSLIDGAGTLAVTGLQEYHKIMGRTFNFPTVKPLAVAEKLIRHLCPENGTVLDCFAGTGTTGHACLNLNRRFILIENAVADITEERIRRVISGDWVTGKQEAAPVPVKAGSSDPSGSTKVVPIPTVNAERLSKQIRMLYKDFASIDVTTLSPTDLEDYRWAMDEIRNLRAVLESPATETFLSDKNAL
jgi:hypothetical protein